jgi:prepilin-type N-terminal cleavage/methylation domain-containing protein
MMICAVTTPMHRQQGFTIAEVIVTVAILSLVLGMGLPQLGKWRDSFDRHTARQQVEFDLKRAKAESASNGSRGIFVVDDDLSTYTFGVDLLPYNDPPEFDRAVFSRNLPGSITFSAVATPIVFSPRGYLVDEFDNLTTQFYGLSQHDEVFCTATVYAVGTVEYECE